MFKLQRNSKIYYFSLGRNAIYVVLKLLRISQDDEVLTPAWDCDSTLQPFRAVGCKLLFYKTDPFTFEVDLEHIRSLITEKAKLVHIINHFGQPQNWKKILKFHNDVGIPILEDNAYSYLSGINGRSFGTFGDFSIFSLRKHYPIPDGGTLHINCGMDYNLLRKNCWLYPEQYFIAKSLYISKPLSVLVFKPFRTIISQIKNMLGLQHKSILRAFRKPRPSQTPSEYWFPLYSDGRKKFPPGERDVEDNTFFCDLERSMSLLSRTILAFYTCNKLRRIAERKRNLYRLLVKKLSKINGIRVLHPTLQDGVVPYCISFLVGKDRDNILNKLIEKRHPVWVWPSLSSEILENISNFPDVELLGRYLLQINLHTNLSEDAYLRLVDDMKELYIYSKKQSYENLLD